MNSSQDETEALRRIIAFLLVEYAEKNTVDLWNDDIDSMTGSLDIETSPDRADSTRITYTRPGAAPVKRERKPINHRAEAEKHASQAAHLKSDRQHHPVDPIATDFHLHMAMVHATLARGDQDAADQANARDALTLLRRREYAVREALTSHIAGLLTSTDRGRWSAARSLAQALDAANVNVDNDVDERLTDSGNDPQEVWGGSHLAAEPDPWAASPDITADIPAPVRRVIAVQLASMLLSSDGEAVQGWARNIATALKNEGADLDDAIKTRIYELTLGHSDIPF